MFCLESEVRILTGINKTDRNVHCWLVIIFTWLTLIAADRWKILNNYYSNNHIHIHSLVTRWFWCTQCSAIGNKTKYYEDCQWSEAIIRHICSQTCQCLRFVCYVLCPPVGEKDRGLRLGYLPISGMRGECWPG